MDTIFALSSGAPPAGIAVVRVTGPGAGKAVEALAGRMPAPRRAFHTDLVSEDGHVLDDALVLWFPGPASVTGEDVAEFHLHGGRAIVAAIETEFGKLPGFRRAQPGEFTRRAFANGRIDLAEAEGLADLLAAETEIQRRSAMHMAGGALSARVEKWREAILRLSAEVEAVLDFEDEKDASSLPGDFNERLAALRDELREAASGPSARVLMEGYRVAIAGPPNAGKSTLFNALVEGEAAITAPLAGTTRDVLTRPVALHGVPFLFVDMAGVREKGSDVVEDIGIARAKEEVLKADLVLWLGPEAECPANAWNIDAQADNPHMHRKNGPTLLISAKTGQGLDELRKAMVEHALQSMPGPGENALNERQARLIAAAADSLSLSPDQSDPLILAESLRFGRKQFDALTGRTSTEDVLDTLFGRFCIGK